MVTFRLSIVAAAAGKVVQNELLSIFCRRTNKRRNGLDYRGQVSIDR